MHSKLVRNKIPELIRASGKTPKTFQSSSDGRLSLLGEKAAEESAELLEAIRKYKPREQIVDEMADILEVLYQIAEEMNMSFGKVQNARYEKGIEKGSFSAGIVLLGVDEEETREGKDE